MSQDSPYHSLSPSLSRVASYPRYSLLYPSPASNALIDPSKIYNKKIRIYSIVFIIIGFIEALTTVLTVLSDIPDLWNMVTSSLYLATGIVGLTIANKDSNKAFIILLLFLTVFNAIAVILGVISVFNGTILASENCMGSVCLEIQEDGEFMLLVGIPELVFDGVLLFVLGLAYKAAEEQREKILIREERLENYYAF